MNINEFDSDDINKILSEEYIFDNFDDLAQVYFDRYTYKDMSQLKTPCYIIDEDLLEKNISSLENSFYNYFSQENLNIFYPMKINNHEFILKKMISKGIGLEVASIEEYKIALKLGSEKILYYAPGKTISDLEFFVNNSNFNHIIHVDSFSELNKLKNILLHKRIKINIGVRIYTDDFGSWQKYGINIYQLKDFIDSATASENINFCGIHFHTSRNKNSKIYVETLIKISDYFINLGEKYISKINYIDFGGGFEKLNVEGSYYRSTKKFQITKILGKDIPHNGLEIISLKSSKIDEYISDIYNIIIQKIYPIFGKNIKFFTEPGRIFVSDIMHIITRVTDIKDEDNNIVIVDSGVNMVGRQRAEYEYLPVINLTCTGKITNQKAMIYGNLCTTWDHWGYYCYTSNKLKENDLLLLSNLGTLSYSIAYNFFINKIPTVIII